LLTFFGLVEEIEVLNEVEAVCEELDVLCDGVTIFSFGSSQSWWFFRVFNPGKHCLSFN
jgi:hypothetical protein